MEHDLMITGGTLVDGTGAEPIKADLAVTDGRITQIGDLAGDTAAETIDASGKLVTPGFVDLHTHLDAQIGWDPMMTSSSYHGVTTAMIGNCGVTFAPCGPKNRRYLAELMESVEDISADAIMDGLPWDWNSYGEYLDSINALNPALNIVGLVGHSSVRYEAMGDKSMDEGVQPDDAELDYMVKMVRESMEAGAVGFSTSRFLLHKVPDGRCTPGTWADLRETKAIQEAVIAGGGIGSMFQSANDMATRFETELEMFRDGMNLGCQVLFSGGTGPQGDGGVGRWDYAAADWINPLTTSDGLPTNIVEDVLVEGNYLWMTTTAGLVQMNLTTNATTLYTSASGLMGTSTMSLTSYSPPSTTGETTLFIGHDGAGSERPAVTTIGLTSGTIIGHEFDQEHWWTKSGSIMPKIIQHFAKIFYPICIL